MEPIHKLDWDYLGWKKNEQTNFYLQKDWNQTLHTAINQISSNIFKQSKRGGANHIYVHPKTFCIINTFEYFYNNHIAGRFKVHIDDKLPKDKIIIKFIDENLEEVRKTFPNACYGIKETKDPNNQYGFIELAIMYLEQPNSDAVNEGFYLVTEEMLTGEITILNHHTIDPVTGEILVDYHTEISEDYWTPSPKKEMFDKSTALVNKVNEPLIKEEEKEIKLSLFQRLKNIINNEDINKNK